MNREQFADMALHRVGHSKSVSGAQLDRTFYNHHESLAPENWPYKAQTAQGSIGRELKPRTPQDGDCLACNGSGWCSQDKGKSTGSLRYRLCSDCKGSGRQ